jgi:hypothetical protein
MDFDITKPHIFPFFLQLNMEGGPSDIKRNDSISVYLRIKPSHVKNKPDDLLIQDNTVTIDQKSFTFDNIGEEQTTQEVYFTLLSTFNLLGGVQRCGITTM